MADRADPRRVIAWSGALDLFCRWGLAAALLWSGVAKALDYPATLVAVQGYDLVPAFAEQSIAAALPALEIVLAMLLLLGLCTRLAARATALLFGVFLAVMTQALARGVAIGCGCFAGGATLSWRDLVRDLPLLAAALYLALRRDGPLRLDAATGTRRGETEAAGGEGRGDAALPADAPRPASPGWTGRLRIAAPAATAAAVLAVAIAAPVLNSGSSGAAAGVHVAGPVRSEPVPAGSTLPEFSAPALGGGQISWASYRGAPTVLIVWAPWCPECEAELLRIVRAARQFPAVHLTSIVTAIGDELGPAPPAYMRSHGYTFPVGLDSASQRLADALGVSGFPTVYYVGSDGVIKQATVGAAPQHVVESLMAAIAG